MLDNSSVASWNATITDDTYSGNIYRSHVHLNTCTSVYTQNTHLHSKHTSTVHTYTHVHIMYMCMYILCTCTCTYIHIFIHIHIYVHINTHAYTLIPELSSIHLILKTCIVGSCTRPRIPGYNTVCVCMCGIQFHSIAGGEHKRKMPPPPLFSEVYN